MLRNNFNPSVYIKVALTFYTFSVWFRSIIAHNIEYFNHSYFSFVLHDSQGTVTFLWGRATLHQQGSLKWIKKHPELPLQYIHSISLRVPPDGWVSMVSLCHPNKLMVLHWMAEPVFPMNKLLAKGGIDPLFLFKANYPLHRQFLLSMSCSSSLLITLRANS